MARTPPANSPGVYTWPNHYSSTPLHLKFLRGSESQYDEWIDPRGPPPLTKAPVHLLNASSDFQAWHAALRRLVTTVNMQDGLLYTLPMEEVIAHKRAEAARIPRDQRPLTTTPAPTAESKDPKTDKKGKKPEGGTAAVTNPGATLQVDPDFSMEKELPFLDGPNDSPRSPVTRRLPPSSLPP